MPVPEVLGPPVALPAALVALGPLVVRAPVLVRVLSAIHAGVFRRTRGRVAGRWFGMRILMLETVGRRSGRLRSTPLVYLREGPRLVVIAANGGSDHPPCWWLNLRTAGSGVAIIGCERMQVRARQATGHERVRLWRRLARQIPVENYQGRTTRPLPVVVLSPVGSDWGATTTARQGSAS